MSRSGACRQCATASTTRQGSSSGGTGAGSGFGVGGGCGHGSGFGSGVGVGVGVGRSAEGGVRPATRRSSARSCSRRRAASFAASFASEKLRVLRSDDDAVGDARGGARDLLDRRRDRGRDGADRRVRAVCHRDRAVGHRVELVELVVDPIDGPAGLDDDRQDVALAALDERRDPAEELPELEEREDRADTEQDEEDRQAPVGGVTGGEGDRHRAGSYPVALVDHSCTDNGVVVVEHGDLPGRDGLDRLGELEDEPVRRSS